MRQIRLFVVFILFSLLILTTACGSAQGATQAEGTATPAVEPGTPVEVANVETGDISLIFSYSGNLQSKEAIDIVPDLAGKVESVLVEVGDEVEEGETIARLNQDTYLAQLKQAQAGLTRSQLEMQKMKQGSRPEEVAVAQAAVEVARAALDDVVTVNDDEKTTAAANLARAQAQLQAAQSEYDKIAWAGNVGSTPQAIALEQATIAYEDALADFNLKTTPSDSQLAPLITQLAQAELNLILKQEPFRQIDFSIAEAGVQQAEAAVELAQIQLDRTTIEAPFEGVIAELYVAKGSMVGLQGPIARFVSKEVEVAIEIEETRIEQIFEGQTVSLKLPAYPDQVFPAVVTRIAPTADKTTHTFTVEITPLDEEGLLRSGMFADVSILADERQDTLLVPRDALVQTPDQQPAVYVVEGGTARLRPVEVGLSDGNRIEILSGLEEGETLIIAGQPNLIDGAKVEVVNRL